MAIYKLLLTDTVDANGARGFPRLLEASKLGWLAEHCHRLTAWLCRRGNPSAGNSPPLRAMLDDALEIAVPVPPHVKDSLVYDLTGVRSPRPVRIVFCFDSPNKGGSAAEV